jgi:outer membrane protein assembly factor BamB
MWSSPAKMTIHLLILEFDRSKFGQVSQKLEQRSSKISFRQNFLLPQAALILSLTFALAPANGWAEIRTLTNQWSFVLRYPSDSSPAIGDDGTIYLGVWNGELRAFLPDGSPKWVFNAEREIKSSPAIGSDGTIYFGSRDRKFYAVAPNGRRKWEFKTGAWIDSSPAIGLDGTIYFGSWDKSFYALKPDGSERWQFRTGGEIVSSAAINSEGIIYFGSHDRKFYAMRPDGHPAWVYDTGGPIVSSPAISADATAYISSTDGYFYALDVQGSLRWRLKTGGITESSPVIGGDGTIYVGVNGTLWALSPDGKKRWELGDNLQLVDAAPLALQDGTVCFVSQLGILLNLGGPNPNQFNWVFYQNWYGSVSPAIGRDGKIYTLGNVVGTGVLLYALPTNYKLADSSWPRFRGDAQGTGRASRSN